jgi:hypothetical protein
LPPTEYPTVWALGAVPPGTGDQVQHGAHIVRVAGAKNRYTRTGIVDLEHD